MSCDLSAPGIGTALEFVREPNRSDSPWLLLAHDAHDRLQLLATGTGLPALRQKLTHDVSFSLMNVDSKYLLVTFLPDGLSGVKRARALVASRYLANAFGSDVAVSINNAGELERYDSTPDRPPTPPQKSPTLVRKLEAASLRNPPPTSNPSTPRQSDASAFQDPGRSSPAGQQRSAGPSPEPPLVHSPSSLASARSRSPPSARVDREPPRSSSSAASSRSELSSSSKMLEQREELLRRQRMDADRARYEAEHTARERQAAEQREAERVQWEEQLRHEAEEIARLEAAELRRREGIRRAEEVARRAHEEQVAALEAATQRLELERQSTLAVERLAQEQQIRDLEITREHQRLKAIVDVARLAEEKRERKAEVVRSLHELSASGLVMLDGYVTVQSENSTSWRRRFFELTSKTLSLYKHDSTAAPIEVIETSLLRKSIVEQPEEVSVLHAFKLTYYDDDTSWLMYCDGPDEKELLLVALRLGIAGNFC